MGTKTVAVDSNLLEQIAYESGTLPYYAGTDNFDEFINGEINCHWHDELEFDLVLRGEMECQLHLASGKTETRLLREHDGVFVNTKSLHSAIQTKPGTLVYCLILPPQLFTLRSSDLIYRKNVRPVLELPLAGLFLSNKKPEDQDLLLALRRLYETSQESPCYELLCLERIYGIWRQLVARLSAVREWPAVSTSEGLQEQRVRLMLSYIHRHYSEDLTIDSIAQAAHISRSECFRCFSGIVQKSPMEYLNEYRLSRAAQLLHTTGRSVWEIGASVGYGNASYFGKLFKEKFGVSPGEHRKKSFHTKNAVSGTRHME